MYIKLLSGRLTYLRNMTQVNVLPGLPAAPSEKGALAEWAPNEDNTPQQRLELLDTPDEWA
jgi:hypothetical protein